MTQTIHHQVIYNLVSWVPMASLQIIHISNVCFISYITFIKEVFLESKNNANFKLKIREIKRSNRKSEKERKRDRKGGEEKIRTNNKEMTSNFNSSSYFIFFL